MNTETTGHYLKVFFACCELVLQMILKVENATGKPSYGLCIFDMDKVALTNHINPASSCNKVFKARALIWEDFYPGMIKNIAIANSPMMLSFIWNIVKFLLNEKQRNLLKFCRNSSQLIQIVGKEKLPVAYGGDWLVRLISFCQQIQRRFQDKEYTTKTDCCNEIKKITPNDYYVVDKVFTNLGVDPLPPAITFVVKANTKHRIVCTPQECNGKQIIAWKFTTTDLMQFSVHNGKLNNVFCLVVLKFQMKN